MPKVTYIEANGQSHEVDLDAGVSLMQGAVDNMIEGIVAECGGSCSCATCHCYIDQQWLDKLEPATEMENDLLECVTEPKDNSRLSCQIVISDDLNGLVVHLPESQF
ncbi:MAG: 2Fe-2S iron-sulfur cluster-binding protein [Porticoccaceae bacterium]|jgi:2Fe-2S ferredoxin|nr:2Fe-2S iron-sulfur cluster-binding protein [Porticoccaceae bacterium]